MRKIQIFAIILGLGFMSACSDDSEEPSNVNGNAAKGYVGSANVEIYQYLETGARGKLLASTVTDVKGNYNTSVDYKGAVEVVVSGGSYIDEATGDEVLLGNNELRSLVMLNGSQQVAVTALTTIAAEHADANASAGLAVAIENANKATARAFGLSNVDITATLPADLSYSAESHSEAQIKYGAIQAGFSQYVMEQGLAAGDLLLLIKDFSKDYADGRVDSKSGDASIEMSTSITPQAAAGGLGAAIKNFMASNRNKSNASVSFSFSFSFSG